MRGVGRRSQVRMHTRCQSSRPEKMATTFEKLSTPNNQQDKIYIPAIEYSLEASLKLGFVELNEHFGGEEGGSL